MLSTHVILALSGAWVGCSVITAIVVGRVCERTDLAPGGAMGAFSSQTSPGSSAQPPLAQPQSITA